MKTSIAREKAKDIGSAGVWIDHAKLTIEDLNWLVDVERLTLWNVSVPENFFKSMPSLWWVDWRGGSAKQDIGQIGDCKSLRYLSLNQIRGLSDVEFISQLTCLELLNLYGLSKLADLPSMKGLTGLRRAQVGQVKSLISIKPLLQAPNLEEILFHNWVKVDPDDVAEMKRHPSLASFEWFGPDIPDKMWVPVRDALALPKARAIHPEEWFGLPT